MVCSYLLLFIFCVHKATGSPLNSEDSNASLKRSRRQVNNQDAVNYLHQFGYLPPANIMAAGFGTPELESAKEKLREAIRRFQRIADIPETGEIDSATKDMMDKPRCGVPDVASLSYGRARLKWDKTQLTYSIVDMTSDIPQDIVKKALREAFNFWSQVTPLDFREVASNGDIKIGFKVLQHNDAYPFDGAGGVLAHALYPKFGLLHFDDDEKWTYKDAGKIARDYTDLLYVAIHEIGHALGVDHIENKNSIMYFSYKEPIDFRGRYIEPSLHAVDVAAIQDIYGKRSTATPARRPQSGRRNDDEVMIGDADPIPGNSGGSRGSAGSSIGCPSKVDAIVADGPITLIFDGDHVFELNRQRRVVKQWQIQDVFQGAPSQVQAAVIDHKHKKLLIFEGHTSRFQRGGHLYAYFHSAFFNRYLKAYDRHFRKYHDLTGAISFKSGATILLDKNYKFAKYNAGRGVSDDFTNIEFANFPRDVRGAISATSGEEKFYLFTQNRVYLYNTDNEVVESETPLSQWIVCS